MLHKIMLAAALFATSVGAQAKTVTYSGSTPATSNCFPFGCPDSFGAHMGFVYKNIDPFALQAGDIIAFDTGLKNDKELRLTLSLAATTVNGGSTANSAGFIQVASLAPGVFGDDIVGNYDIAFVLDKAFTFTGGGLMMDFVNVNGTVSDTTSEQNLVYSSTNPYAVGRFYGAATPGGLTGTGAYAVGNFSIITTAHDVPEPDALALLGLGLAAMSLGARRARSARKHQQ